ncbi:hypothetical protein EXIGLDRAFT_781429 [Exidia glandulosa HHB12029]|uniref:Uncharacterized protein n=1 Tax=Exidia glandulosa HHB12029 TaxID=1314781 RepID=A0A165B956_EXIGL|nr:hypothetical protein EXIGLDRAFT_781429 [Exidia glandulosa HHB12029]
MFEDSVPVTRPVDHAAFLRSVLPLPGTDVEGALPQPAQSDAMDVDLPMPDDPPRHTKGPRRLGTIREDSVNSDDDPLFGPRRRGPTPPPKPLRVRSKALGSIPRPEQPTRSSGRLKEQQKTGQSSPTAPGPSRAPASGSTRTRKRPVAPSSEVGTIGRPEAPTTNKKRRVASPVDTTPLPGNL